MQKAKLVNWLAVATILGVGAMASTPALAVKVGNRQPSVSGLAAGKGQEREEGEEFHCW